MKRFQIHIYTSYGPITVELESGILELTVGNFVNYVEEGFYNNTLIHRVIDNFLIQGGGFEREFIRKTTRPPIRNESADGLQNKRGTIAMARLPEEPDSATSQFFINARDNDELDYRAGDPAIPGYCAFGRVIDGMQIIDNIAEVGTTTTGDHKDVPVREIVIERMEQIRKI
jgi:peptidyl-prolyl cis-trans isomerase B (cyclophilin B)